MAETPLVQPLRLLPNLLPLVEDSLPGLSFMREAREALAMILLALVFFGVAATAGTLLSWSGGLAWQVARLALVVSLPVLSFAVWQAAQPPTGWPAHARYSKTAQFQWAVVREPDQLTGDPGEIDLWLTPAGATRPRAYRVAYTRQLHKQVNGAMRAVKGGVRVGIRKVANRKGAYTSRSRFTFYRLPPPLAEAKD